MKPIRFALAGLIALALPPAAASAEPLSGRLDASDPRLEEGQYYEEWVFDASAGQAVKFEIVSRDFTPYALLYSPSWRLVEHTQGVWFAPDEYRLGTEWPLPEAGTWHLIVTQSFPEEGDYTLDLELVGAPARARPVLRPSGEPIPLKRLPPP